MQQYNIQGDHSPDNMKFPDGSQHASAALGMLSVTHIMPVLVLLSVVGVGMQRSETIYLVFNTEQTPTKYLYGCKYAAYNKQF